MGPNAKTRLKCAIVVAFIVGLIIVVPGVLVVRNWMQENVWERRYPNRKQCWRDIGLHSVYDGDKLIYAFAIPRNTHLVETHDLHGKPQEEGIFWIAPLRSGLWVKGTKVSIPEGYKIIAIRRDGTIVPIAVTQTELDSLARQFGGLEGLTELHVRLAAALRLPASGNPSTRP